MFKVRDSQVMLAFEEDGACWKGYWVFDKNPITLKSKPIGYLLWSDGGRLSEDTWSLSTKDWEETPAETGSSYCYTNVEDAVEQIELLDKLFN